MNVRCFAPMMTIATMMAVACSKSNRTQNTTVVDSTGPATASAPDTIGGIAPGMTMSETPARDADQGFMRKMVDHHEGMIQMAQPAIDRGSVSVQADAQKLLEKQSSELAEMREMLKAKYQDGHMPMVMPENKAMTDSVAALSGTALNRSFRSMTIMHHEEGIKMMEDFGPRLADPKLRAMSAKMKADQQKEVADFKNKLKSGKD